MVVKLNIIRKMKIPYIKIREVGVVFLFQFPFTYAEFRNNQEVCWRWVRRLPGWME